MNREGSPYSNRQRAAGGSIRTRVGSYFATLFVGRSVQILPVRPNRLRASIFVNAGAVSIGDDISQLLRGEGALLSNLTPTTIEGGGEVWATASAAFLPGISTDVANTWLGWQDPDGTVGYLLWDVDAGVNVTITEVLAGV